MATIGGKKSYELRKGIHGRLPEQMSEDGKKATVASGGTLWIERKYNDLFCSLSEIEYAYNISHAPVHRTPQGKVRFRHIAPILNNEFHDGNPIRTSSKVKAAVKRYKEKL